MEKLRNNILVKINRLRIEIYSLYLAYRDPGVKWYVKVFLLVLLSYALSPVDIIPDGIPIIGYLDDLILLPFGVYLAWKVIPVNIQEQCRAKARTDIENLKMNWLSYLIVILSWLALLGIIVYVIFLR